MPESLATSDIVLSALLLFGIVQLAWFSVMLLRRGAPPETIQHAIPSLLSIWILMWPVYSALRWLWAGVIIMSLFSLAAISLKSPFWRHLRFAWSPKTDHSDINIYYRPNLPPLAYSITAIFIASLWFQTIPEFGFGLGLCFCLAFPAAYWMDQLCTLNFKIRNLGFPAHPDQTLAFHLIFILATTALLCWGLHVYHGTDWKALIIATLIAALAASSVRALVPGGWNIPAAMASAGCVMWLL